MHFGRIILCNYPFFVCFYLLELCRGDDKPLGRESRRRSYDEVFACTARYSEDVNTGGGMHILTSIENSSDLPLCIHMMSTSGVEFDIDPSMLIFSCNPDLRISIYAPL